VVAIEGNDPKLMPDLSAAVDVDVAKQSAQSGSEKSAPQNSAPQNNEQKPGSGS